MKEVPKLFVGNKIDLRSGDDKDNELNEDFVL